MINFIVAYDDRDANLGSYFKDCRDQLSGILTENGDVVNGEVREISGLQCNAVYIDAVVQSCNANPFVFIAYSHGDENALCCGNYRYVEKDVNALLFARSLFYTTACSAGKKLGVHLIDKGCWAFIGYKNEINVHKQQDKKEISRNCDNAGIMAFLSDNITIHEAYVRMKSYYTQQIDKLNDVKDILFAADLREARDSIVCLGNKDLRKADLFLAQ